MSDSLRHPFRCDELPLLGRLNRGAFRAGSPNSHPLQRLASRMGLYALRGISRKPVWGKMSVNVGGQWRSAKFDARNRMFCCIYFERYQHGVDPTVMGVLEKLLPNDGVFYDVGANWGYHSICVASRPGFRGQVCSFEPNPPTFADLLGIVREIKLDRINLYNLAIGESDAQGFIECGNHSGFAHLSKKQQGLPVQIRSLDSLDLPPPNVMKVDTEGHEEQVFRGAEKLLTKHKPIVVFEHCFKEHLSPDRYKTALELLESYGYKLFLPTWRGEHVGDVLDAAVLRHPALVKHGLQLYDCTSESRLSHPEFTDLLACHRDRLSLLSGVATMPLQRAA